jgi:DNA-directed RNA polymerase
MEGDSDAIVTVKQQLNSLLRQVPTKGDFKLENVLDSVYFFS